MMPMLKRCLLLHSARLDGRSDDDVLYNCLSRVQMIPVPHLTWVRLFPGEVAFPLHISG